jgi:glyoxylase-like metal-dependent hydrolase (beta-lactamase superfamily II)
MPILSPYKNTKMTQSTKHFREVKTGKTTGFFNFRVGNLHLTVITDGQQTVKLVRPVQTADSTPQELENILRSQAVDKALQDNFLPVDEVHAALNILLLQTGSKRILIDTGFGSLGSEENGKLMENLSSAGISASDITDIILTHAHMDHMGGLLDKDQNHVFSDAIVHMPLLEHNFWFSENPDFSKSRNPDNAPAINLARTTLKAIANKLHFFNDGDILFDCIKVIHAPGHTPGHCMLNIFSEGEELLHTVDIAYSAALVFPHPEWGATLDSDYPLAVETRKKVFEQLVTTRKRAFAYHLHWPGLGFVRRKEGAYEWVAQTFATPQLNED